MSSPLSRKARRVATSAVAAISLIPALAVADGLVVDRVYDPYVQPLETEFEWRSIIQSDDDLGGPQKHSFGVGRGWTDRWATELYVIGAKSSGESISVDAFELEAKWQLTEQGEYAFDWGMVFELERETETANDAWELSTTLIATRDFGKWIGTANVGLIYEWGNHIQNEIETLLRLHARYRFKESLEPAIELHMGQDTVALGPALTGLSRLSPGKKLRWEAGVFLGVDSDSPDRTFKLGIEYEF